MLVDKTVFMVDLRAAWLALLNDSELNVEKLEWNTSD